MAKIAKIGTVRIPCVALPTVALPVVGLRGAAGSGGGGYWPQGTPPEIKAACMLWYDIARQGCTNEGMAANPVLRDLSGNGHDATCHNFAWAGMSGIGGYGFDFGRFLSRDSAATFERSAYAFTVTSIKTTGSFLETNSATATNPPFTVKVSGLGDAGAVLKYGSDTTSFYEMPQDGIYELPEVTSPFTGFRFDKAVEQCNIAVEIMPLYPGALVSDGVDDYAVVENAPILYNEKGFTIIAKREILQSINERPLSAIIADNRLETLDGAFLFEGLWKDTRTLLNFGRSIYNQIFPELYSYMTSVEYNGEKILKGQIEHGSEKYTIFACDINNIRYPLSVALYSLLLFNRDLTTEEIEWVKTNMMQQ